MKPIRGLVIAVIAGLVLFCLSACDSNGNGGGGATASNTATGYNISDFAGEWEMSLTGLGGGISIYRIELDQAGSMVSFKRTSPAGIPIDTLIGGFSVISARLAARNVAMPMEGWPRGAYYIARFQLDIKSTALLKGILLIHDVELPEGMIVMMPTSPFAVVWRKLN